MAMVTIAFVLIWYVMNDISFLQFMSAISLMWEFSIHLKKQSVGR